jgi:hypothetical protein
VLELDQRQVTRLEEDGVVVQWRQGLADAYINPARGMAPDGGVIGHEPDGERGLALALSTPSSSHSRAGRRDLRGLRRGGASGTL